MSRLTPLLLALPCFLLPPLPASGAIPARHVAEATDSPFRLGLEAGLAWFGSTPDQAPGASAALRLRWQPAERLFVSGALTRLRQSFPAGLVDTTLLPVTLDLRLDRAPVSPYVGAGVGFVLVQQVGNPEVGRDVGLVLEVGVEVHLTDHFSFCSQATYQGVSAQDQPFPFFSALTAGLEAGF